MPKNLLIGGGVVVVLLLAIIGFVVFRPSAAPSGPMTAVPIVAPTAAPPSAAAPAPAEDAATPEAPASAAAPEASAQIFEIVPAESEARFLIDEVLRGAPITVAGVTSLVTGQIAVDAANPSASQVGVIQINARDLTTDNEFRNRAVRNNILQTERYELISFAPTELTGMPEQVNVGDSFEFVINGDLTIREVTRPVSFTVNITAASATELQGLATTSVLYRDFELSIPEVPSVDLVADEVRLELAFVARSL
ncbi:MAG: YceI family protein [Candidatus Viridilinea halotolerans]|uniref:YceI family protein n=1 Tax=Candidatus Viridilinea halotolerans TaxID=2491704 RepID=A0A426TZG6_9CHLR|nr:MAG: YceI family protein [Candidatus Viridilinea halotolerans]